MRRRSAGVWTTPRRRWLQGRPAFSVQGPRAVFLCGFAEPFIPLSVSLCFRYDVFARSVSHSSFPSSSCLQCGRENRHKFLARFPQFSGAARRSREHLEFGGGFRPLALQSAIPRGGSAIVFSRSGGPDISQGRRSANLPFPVPALSIPFSVSFWFLYDISLASVSHSSLPSSVSCFRL